MARDATPLLEAQGLHLRLGRRALIGGGPAAGGRGSIDANRSTDAGRALDGASLALHRGEWMAIVGPNGAGKSSLLRALAGLVAPDAGTVLLDARPLRDYGRKSRARRIAWLAQDGDAAAGLSVADTVALGRLPWRGLFDDLTADDRRAIDAALVATGCDGWRDRQAEALSGGELRRVLLARALAVEAEALLLDEPTTHLDPPHQVELVRLLAAEARRGRCVAAVLHDLSLALAADRVAVMAAGRVIAVGRPGEPALHAAIAEVFGAAIEVMNIGGGAPRWVAVPRV